MSFPAMADGIQQVLERAHLSFDLAGAVLFGSAARGQAGSDSDIDLLVVARNIPAKRHRRSWQIAEIKHLFPGMPLDILLMTEGEARGNFENHNPLFLDIAEDGIVLLDHEGILSTAMRATAEYIRARGIKRTDGGWQFPVERGMPTYFSNVSNSDYSRAMLSDADRDYRIGQRLIEGAFYDKAVYHFQQAVEKSIKAVLLALGVYRKTHLVGAVLRDLCEQNRVPLEWKERLLQAAAHSEQLEPDLSLSRYPGIVDDALWLPAEEYGLEDAQAARVRSAEALEIALTFVREWFSGPS